jgi:hypothetical protein
MATVLPYPRFDIHRVKLAMKIADRYRLSEIRRRDWVKAAEQLKLDSVSLLGRIVNMGEAILELAPEIGTELKHGGLEDPVIDKLVTRLVARSRACLKQVEA